LAGERVLVAPFENHTGDPAMDPVGSMAADWIIQGLAHTGLVSVVPVTSSIAASRFTAAAVADADAAHRTRLLAEETGAGIVITGTYYRQADSLYLRATVTDVGAGRVLHALEAIATPAALPLDGIERLRQRVMSVLAARLDPRMRDHATLPGFVLPSFDAYTAFAEGLELFMAREWRAALPPFAEAAARDSSFMPALVFGGIARLNLGNMAGLDSIVALLRPRLHLLTAFERSSFDFLEAQSRGDAAAAYQATRRNPQLAPGTLAHWGLANAALWVNRPRETLQVLAQLDPMRGELRGWVLYWRDLAWAHHLLGEHRTELKVARRARALYPDDPVVILMEGRALAALHRTRELHRLLASLRDDDMNPPLLMRMAGLELIAHGMPDPGTALLRRSLDWQTENPGSAASSIFLADSYYHAGQHADAERLLLDLAARFPGAINVQGSLGAIAASRGDTAEATRIADWLASLEQPHLRGHNTYQRARIAALLGDRDQAVRLLGQAHREGFFLWTPLHTEPAFAVLRDHASFRAFVRPKG
jgi:TolB-like protein/tetratricopeptide (TPR) repeat protein